MLILLLGAFMVASGYVLLRKRSIESFFLSGMCISLMLEFTGILIFAAKRAAIPDRSWNFCLCPWSLRQKSSI